jgi:hypothetical protein
MDTHLAFSLGRDAIRDRVLIPKYYDPDLSLAATMSSTKFELCPLGDILASGERGSRLGSWIRRELYGSGDVPFVRTSDLSHWRVRPDYKKGVAEDVYQSLRATQDVKASDILMVAHGTYLVGNVAIVTETDQKLVLQDHVFRLRVRPESRVSPYYLLAALSTRFVRRQIRARQFSADIIDKLGNRHLELLVPLLRNHRAREAVTREVRSIIQDQSLARERIAEVTGSTFRMTRERAHARYGFSVDRSDVRKRVLIPKYYDPVLETDLIDAEAADPIPWVTLGQLWAKGAVSISAGVEVGKMAYGTGAIPFVRTSDLAGLELKLDVRHGVSEDVYKTYAHKAALSANDIVVVRDGTYLVGSSALVSESDLPALFCGGILRLRIGAHSRLSPYALLAVLNLPIVRRQMRARQFTRDVIDTLGTRISEIRIPAPDSERYLEVAHRVREVMQLKESTKARIEPVVKSIEPAAPAVLSGRPSWSMR